MPFWATDASRALVAAGGLRTKTLVVPILEGNEWCALVILGFPAALTSHMLEARRCCTGTQQRATQPALLSILADPASRGAGLRSQSVRCLQDVVTVASCLANGLPTTTASLQSPGHVVRTLLTPIDLVDGVWEMDLLLTGPSMLAHVFFLLSAAEEHNVSLMHEGREEWDGVLTARGTRGNTRGLLLAHRHGPASLISVEDRGRRVHNANNAESVEASGNHSRDGHGHGSVGLRGRSFSRGSGGSYHERLQRAADANIDSDNNSAGPLADHSVASCSPRVAMTRGKPDSSAQVVRQSIGQARLL